MVLNIFLVFKAFFYYQDFYFAESNIDYAEVNTFSKNVQYQFKKTISSLKDLNVYNQDLCELKLEFSSKNLNRLNHDLPKSGENEVKATLIAENKRYPVKVKYRGDSSSHWFYNVKSYRIKIEGDDVRFRNLREFSLTLPQTQSFISEIVAFRIAKDFGILTQDLLPTSLCVNDEYMGFYQFQEPVKEDFFTKNHLIYHAVFVGKSNQIINFDGIVTDLFLNPFFWELRGDKEPISYGGYQPLIFLINVINQSRQDWKHNYMDFLSVIDLEYFAKFSALVTFFQTVHYDNFHNFKLYFNPSTGEFQQINDDPGAWFYTFAEDFDFLPTSLLNNRLFTILHKNPEFIHLKQKYLFYLIKKYNHKYISSLFWDLYSSHKKELENDYFKPFTKFINHKKEISKVLQSIKINEDFITKTLNDEDICYTTSENKIKIYSYGRTAKKIVSIKSKSGNPINLTRVKSEKKIDLKSEIFYPGRKFFHLTELNKQYEESFNLSYMVYQYILKIRFLRPESFSYELESQSNLQQEIEGIQFINLITGKTFKKTPSESCNFGESRFSIHPWELEKIYSENADSPVNFIFPDDPYGLKFLHYKNMPIEIFQKKYPIFTLTPDNKLVLKSGNYEISQTIVIPKNTELIIEPGVNLNMGEKVSWVSYSKIIAQAQPQNPIVIKSLNDSKPFGVFALAGNGASESKFEYLQIQNGSEAFINGIFFSGMFSAYHSQNVLVKNSSFSDAQADDAVNFKYSNSKILNSSFSDNFMDGLDYDFMSGELSGNTFQNNGNDAVDLSGSTAIISENKFYKSGDKCLSVGEASQILAFENIFDSCNIALAVKDSSKALIFNSQIKNNKVAINAYQKKAFFAGGQAFLINNFFKNNLENTSFKNGEDGKNLKTDDSTITSLDSLGKIFDFIF